MSDNDTDNDIEILRIETLSAERYPLRKIRFAQRRKDGRSEPQDREVYELPASVAVLPFDCGRRTVLLVRQVRLPAFLNGDAARLIEACAGHVDPGEEPAAAARREAEEELGYRFAAVQPVFTLYTSPGLTSERLHFFIAEYTATMVHDAGGGIAAEGEDIEIIEAGLDAAYAMVADGVIIDAKTVLLLQHLMLAQREPRQRGAQPAHGGGGGVSVPSGGTE